MDTQGAFDNEFTREQSSTVIALSFLTSSIQGLFLIIVVFLFSKTFLCSVYKLMYNFEENNLQDLEFFFEYGRGARNSLQEKPFQKLIFLIRDWPYKKEYPYGSDSGKKFLKKKFELKKNAERQLRYSKKNSRIFF